MIKTYMASSNVHINVVLANKRNRHISFMPLSDGRSVFSTDDVELQKAIERHSRFGSLFFLSGAEPVVPEVKPVEDNGTPILDDETPKLVEVEVSDASAAKDYLAENFGISRSSLRSVTAILKAGEGHGIVFKGI